MRSPVRLVRGQPIKVDRSGRVFETHAVAKGRLMAQVQNSIIYNKHPKMLFISALRLCFRPALGFIRWQLANYAILAESRNCLGVTPMSRLK